MCLLVKSGYRVGRDFDGLDSKRDTLVSNESVSNQPDGQDDALQDASSAFATSLDGHYAELILDNLIDAFHATSVLACTPDGVILFANKVAAYGFNGFTPQTVIGQNILNITPKAWALERIELLKYTIERKRPLVVVEIIAGTRLCSTITPIERTDNDQSEWILLITVEQVTPTKLKKLRDRLDPDDIINAKVIDLGPLSALTRRELEVLALIGQGLRQKQIADKLHRSVSTIDRHRERIGEKLGITDRIELVTMAREAALEFSDATRTDASFGLVPAAKKSDNPEPT